MIKDFNDKIKDDFILRMSRVEYCSEEEEKEIIDHLSKLTDDDLEIVERKIIKLNDILRRTNDTDK